MKIVCIFADKLFAFHYDNEDENELKRNLELWTNINYLYEFLKAHKNDIGKYTIEQIIEQISNDANTIDDFLAELSNDEHKNLDSFFKPLHNQEYQLKILSLRKGRKNLLRIYAIKIDEDCFVITGGAIKLTQLMEDREHTKKELTKLEKAKQYLKENSVFDSDSFYEFIKE